MPSNDENTPAPERKSTVITDLPTRDEHEDAADVKGGAIAEPCIRAPRLKPVSYDPCIRPGGVSGL